MNKVNYEYLFTLIAIAQAFFVIGYTFVVFMYYIPKSHQKAKDSSFLSWHVVTVSISYIMLTLATVYSAAALVYTWGDWWYWIVTAGYITGDISLIQVFKHAVKKREIEKRQNKN